MKKILSLIVLCNAALVGNASAASIEHSNILPWNHNVEAVASLLQPRIRFEGCDPYPSVNHEGKTSAGLSDTGSPRSGCSDGSRKQVHYRGICFTEKSRKANGREIISKGKVGKGRVCARMYSYFMPKDVGTVAGAGHRFDWEDIIVWTRDEKSNGQERVLGVSFSGHGKYKKVSAPDVKRDKTRALAIYGYDGTTHAMLPAKDTITRRGRTIKRTPPNPKHFNGPIKIANYHVWQKSNHKTIEALEQWQTPKNKFGSNAVVNIKNGRFDELLKRSWNNDWSNYAGQHWKP